MRDESFELVGQWKFLRSDEDASEQTDITIIFDEQEGLTYKIRSQGKIQIIKLTYRVENGWLITDQPSHPRVERTRFQITPLGELVLEFEGFKSWYQKL